MPNSDSWTLCFQVHILHWQPQDVMVLSPQWLCEDVIGKLLSIEFITQARVTGCFTVEDFQAAFTEFDASKLLVLLEQLQLCTHVSCILPLLLPHQVLPKCFLT